MKDFYIDFEKKNITVICCKNKKEKQCRRHNNCLYRKDIAHLVLIFIKKKCEFGVSDERFGILIYTGEDAESEIGVGYM